MELLAIQNLSFAYPERTERALDGVSLTVEAGELAAAERPRCCGS